MDINQALQKLYSMRQFNIKLGLDNVKGLLEFIGNPHKKLKCFHIAGSNGKGSTATFLSSILIEHGYKTGLYTSPHLVRFNERIRINGVEIDDDYIGKFIQEIDEYIIQHEPTFFEITTALAFKYFYENDVDYAVIEVGLGGRLDATNLIENPIACLITSISLEHTNILGNALSKIAWEKAGIIKPNSKVFIGNLVSEAELSIEKVVEEKNANLIPLMKNLELFNDHVELLVKGKTFKIYELPLLGKHQYLNAALAVLSFTKTFEKFNELKISKGLRNVIANSGHSCRLEKVNDSPEIIFDAAHNLEGLETLLNFIRSRKQNYSELNVLFGVSNDKNYEEMIIKLSKIFNNIYISSFNYPKALPTSELKAAAVKNQISVTEVLDKIAFIEKYKTTEKFDSLLVVMGSIYMLGEILSEKNVKIS
ncbi:MAG: bifunctional folylpolyglutamate synthase/dihydrofolate synthase [Melioribacteraceae bacterium]|nr:bifunctional folylpolyglutamate synthase/dihydrofolate synthase [Melioribacteraceae bacterium]